MPRLLLPALCCLVAVVCAAGLSFAFADDGKPSLPESVTTTLQPGDNQIGWVAERMSAEDLFARLPQVVLVYTWDADSGRYEIAAPRLPQRYWTIRFLEPGQGYVLRVGGADSVDWERSVLPASGLVKLRSGLNWSAWAGRDDSAIADVARGIGSSLLSIRSGDLIYDPSVPESMVDWPAVQRGDALEVSVSRNVNWLQPTFITPRVVFLGNATSKLQKSVMEDVEIVMSHYVSELGIQIDGADADVYIVEDLDDLIAYRGLEDEETEDLRSLWDGSGGWSDERFGVVVKLKNWRLRNTHEFERHGDGSLGRYFLTHELFHRLPHQLSGWSSEPTWLAEGAAVWIDAALRHRESGAAFESILSKRRKIAFDGAPRLGDPEAESGVWPYHLGTLAVNRLAQRYGSEAVIEFWRSLLPRSFGPLDRWRSTPPWQVVFEEVFGLEAEEFYAEFNAWLGWPRGETGDADTERGEPTTRRIEGKVTGPDGSGLPFVEVVAQGDALASAAVASALTSADGSYSIVLPAAGRYHIYADLNSCTASYHRDGVAGRWDQATLVHVRQANMSAIDMQIPENWCVLRISGRLLDHDGAAVRNVWISATGPSGIGGGESTSDGAFTIAVPDHDRFLLGVYQFGCSLYDTGIVATRNPQAARLLDVSGTDLTDIEFRLPEDPISACN